MKGDVLGIETVQRVRAQSAEVVYFGRLVLPRNSPSPPSDIISRDISSQNHFWHQIQLLREQRYRIHWIYLANHSHQNATDH